MKRQSVTSSNIAEVGYEPKTKTLEILFKSGGVYTYSAVEQDVFDALVGAESVGGYFARHIKGVYDYIRIR